MMGTFKKKKKKNGLASKANFLKKKFKKIKNQNLKKKTIELNIKKNLGIRTKNYAHNNSTL